MGDIDFQNLNRRLDDRFYRVEIRFNSIEAKLNSIEANQKGKSQNKS